MQVVLPLIVLILTAAAAEPPSGVDDPALSPTQPGVEAPEVQIDPTNGKVICRERIEQVREERGLPWIDRGTAPDEQGLLIAAVDKTIDGCSVLVMRNDTSDIRPVPSSDSPARLRPAR